MNHDSPPSSQTFFSSASPSDFNSVRKFPPKFHQVTSTFYQVIHHLITSPWSAELKNCIIQWWLPLLAVIQIWYIWVLVHTLSPTMYSILTVEAKHIREQNHIPKMYFVAEHILKFPLSSSPTVRTQARSLHCHKNNFYGYISCLTHTCNQNHSFYQENKLKIFHFPPHK